VFDSFVTFRGKQDVLASTTSESRIKKLRRKMKGRRCMEALSEPIRTRASFAGRSSLRGFQKDRVQEGESIPDF